MQQFVIWKILFMLSHHLHKCIGWNGDKMEKMVRLYPTCLITLSVYSIVKVVTFIGIMMVSVHEIHYQIRSNINSTFVLNSKLHNHSDLKRVLATHNISTSDIMLNNCEVNDTSHQKTIVLVPYRNRTNNLKLFVSPLHQHLMNQVVVWSC